MASIIDKPTSKAQKETNKKSKKEEEATDFGILDYKDFLKVRKLDFISDLIVGTEESAKAILDDEERRLREEVESQKREEEEMRRKERHESLEFRRGTWNSKIINYIGDMKTRNGLTIIEETESTSIDASSAKISQLPKRFSLLSKNTPQSNSIALVQDLQQRFEIIWSNLKMPLDQKIDMVKLFYLIYRQLNMAITAIHPYHL